MLSAAKHLLVHHMTRERRFYVYILSSRSRNLYVGVTGDLVARVCQHKERTVEGFTARYGIDRLVYYEEFPRAFDAIAREKQVKGLLRSKKIALIEAMNPTWDDLSDGWYEHNQTSTKRAR